jgi:hypothetical protein
MRLETEKSLVLQAGNNDAFGAYQGLSGRYIAESQKPPVLGTTFGLCFGAGGAGVLIGTLIKD